MKKRLRAFLFLPALTCFALASCGSKTEEERCSYLHELAKPSAIDTTNELGSFSGGNLGPLIKGQLFSTTIDFQASSAGAFIFETYFVVGSKRTRVGGSSFSETYYASSLKKSYTIEVPSSLLNSDDGGKFEVKVRKTSGTNANKSYSWSVNVPLGKTGEIATCECKESVSFPSYDFYWSSPNHLTPYSLNVSIDASESRKLLYKEQDNDAYDYILMSAPAVYIDYRGKGTASFEAELWLFDHFEDFPLAKSGNHIAIPMKSVYVYGGGIHLLRCSDTYRYSRVNLEMRKPGDIRDNDIVSNNIFLPIGKGRVNEKYNFSLHILNIGPLKCGVLIPGFFLRHKEHYGNPFYGEYTLKCGLGE